MTVQDLHDKVTFFHKKTTEIMGQNPGIEEVCWVIRDIPYHVFNECVKYSNDGKSTQSGDQLFYIKHGYGHGTHIVFWSVPLKIKTVYEVEEITEQVKEIIEN